MANAAIDESVMIRQSDDEFRRLVTWMKEKQVQVSPVPTPSLEIAYYGPLGQALMALRQSMMKKLRLSTVLMKFGQYGDKLMKMEQYTAADPFWGYILDRTTSVSAIDTDQDREWTLLRIEALYGQATGHAKIAQTLDPNIKYPATLERFVKCLHQIQNAMELAFALESSGPPHPSSGKYSWIIYNGTIHIYAMAKPLLALGFAREVVPFLSWSVLSLEALVTFCTTKYILWRVRLYASICACFEQQILGQAHFRSKEDRSPSDVEKYRQAAATCAQRGLDQVLQLRREEEMDLPLPASVETALVEAEKRMTILNFKYKSGFSLPEFKTTFPNLTLQIQATLALSSNVQTVMELSAVLYEELYESSYIQVLDAGVANNPLILNDVYQYLEVIFPLVDYCEYIKTLHQHQLGTQVDQELVVGQLRLQHAQEVGEKTSVHPIEAMLTMIGHFRALERSEQTATKKMVFFEQASGQYDPQALIQCCRTLMRYIRDIAYQPTLLRQAEYLLHMGQSFLWKRYGQRLLSDLDAMPMLSIEKLKAPDELPSILRTVLLTLHSLFQHLALDDILLRSYIGLRLGVLLVQQHQHRLAIQVLRSCLRSVERVRDEWMHERFHTLHQTSAKQAHAFLSFSTNLPMSLGTILNHESETPPVKDVRDTVSVKGMGAQLGQLFQDLATLQTDLYCTLYQAELALARVHAQSSIHARLFVECHKNGYTKALYLLQHALAHNATSEQSIMDAMQCLRDMQHKERHHHHHESIETTTKTCQVPPVPSILRRGSTFVTLALQPFVSQDTVAYCMVFGKPAGAGTDVSLNNCDYPGTGEPIAVSIDDPTWPVVTIERLIPNDSYVFAVAAYAEDGQIIGSGIGPTTSPVITCSPLPLALCWGYVCKTALKLNLPLLVAEAANVLYDEFIWKRQEDKPRWEVNPLTHHVLRAEEVARASIPVLECFIHTLFSYVSTSATDGLRLTGLPSEGQVLVPQQLKVLDLVQKMCMAIALASAVHNQELVMRACHTGYQLMVPLLHLKQRGHYVLQALVTIQEALQLCMDQWDDPTLQLYSCVAYETLRLGLECSQTNFFQHSWIALQSVHIPHIRSLEASSKNVQFQALQEIVYRLKPQMDTQNEVSDEVLAPALQALSNPIEAMRILQEQQTTAPESITASYFLAVFKICHVGIEKGHYADIRGWLSSLQLPSSIPLCAFVEHLNDQLKFSILSQYKKTTPAQDDDNDEETQKDSIEGEVEQDDVAQDTEKDATKITKGPELDESKEDLDETMLEIHPSHSNEEREQLQICAESSYLNVFIATIELFQLGPFSSDCDMKNSPARDFKWELIDEDPSLELSSSLEHENAVNSTAVQNSISETEDNAEENSPEDAGEDSVSVSSEEDASIIDRIVGQASKACVCFYHAAHWNSLIRCCQCVWNSIWVTWTSPVSFSNPRQWGPLLQCGESLLDMLQYRDSLSSVPSSTDSSAPNVLFDLDMIWCSEFIKYCLQVLASVKQWERCVALGERFHALSCTGSSSNPFTEELFPVVLHGQKQIWKRHEYQRQQHEHKIEVFIQAFHTAQEKKQKRRKARLVVEKVLTEEERAFQEQQAEYQVELANLQAKEFDVRTHYEQLQQMMWELQREKYVCLDSFDKSYFLLEKYQRNATSIELELVIQSFERTVQVCREKRDNELVIQTLMTLGNFYATLDKIKHATRMWNDGLDAVFGVLNTTTVWRELLTSECNPVERFGFWSVLYGLHLLAQLAEHSTDGQAFTKVEYCTFASRLMESIFSCSINHPARRIDFLHYSPAELWPELNVFQNKTYLGPERLIQSVRFIGETLVSYDCALESLPILCAYEYIARWHCADVHATVDARQLKMKVATRLCDFASSCRLYGQMKFQEDLPCAIVADKGTPFVFHNDAPLEDVRNQETLRGLSTPDVEEEERDITTSPSSTKWKGGAENAAKLELNRIELLLSISKYVPYPTTTTSVDDITSDGSLRLRQQAAAGLEKLVVSAQEKISSSNNATFYHTLVLQCRWVQSQIAYWNGRWDQSRSFVTQALELEQTNNGSSEIRLRCRLVGILCFLAQDQLDQALVWIEHALEEALESGDSIRQRDLDMTLAEYYGRQGDLANARQTLVDVTSRSEVLHLTNETYVQLTRMMHELELAQWILAPSSLKEQDMSTTFLTQASRWLETGLETAHRALEESGWIRGSPRVTNVYHPLTPVYYQLQLELAQLLDRAQKPDEKRILALVESALSTTKHVLHPLPTIEPQLLFLLGKYEKHQPLKSKQALKSAIQLSIERGGHDHELCHQACMELAHASAPASVEFYQLMGFAAKLRQTHQLFWQGDLQDLQKSSLSDEALAQALPASICHDILASSCRKMDATKKPALRASTVLCYLKASVRELAVCPTTGENVHLQRMILNLHYAVLANIPAYAQHCCVDQASYAFFSDETGNEQEDTPDADIPSGSVRVQWRMVAPETVACYGSLGSTRPDEGVCSGLLFVAQAVGTIEAVRKQASEIRVDLQDANSTVSKDMLESAFQRLLMQVQKIVSPKKAWEDRSVGEFAMTTETVCLVEDFFHPQRGLDTTNMEFCQLLRSMIDGHGVEEP